MAGHSEITRYLYNTRHRPLTRAHGCIFTTMNISHMKVSIISDSPCIPVLGEKEFFKLLMVLSIESYQYLVAYPTYTAIETEYVGEMQ